MNDSTAPRHGDLPLPDYDHLPEGTLQARVRALDPDGVGQLLAYEKEHANRLPVVQLLESRLSELEQGAEPTAGSPSAPAPEKAGAPTHEPKASPQTSGPPVNPPSQGVPTNPAQPRT